MESKESTTESTLSAVMGSAVSDRRSHIASRRRSAAVAHYLQRKNDRALRIKVTRNNFAEEGLAMKTVDASGLKTLLDGNENVLLVNTLKAESFEKTRIPGAVNVPLENENFVARVEQQAGAKN